MERQRVLTLSFACVAALSAGTNYAVSAYLPQLAAKLHLSSTQANMVSASGNAGVYLSGPFVGILVDRKGPRSMLVGAAVVLFFGYSGLKALYDGGRDGAFDRFGLGGLAICQVLTGIGGSAGLASAVKATSQSFSKARRGAAMATVLSCFGLSAFFYSSLSHAHLLHSSDPTSAFLSLLAIGCGASMLLGAFFVRPCPPSMDPPRDRERGAYVAVESSDPTTVFAEPESTRSLSPAFPNLAPDESAYSLHSDIAIRTPSPAFEEPSSRPCAVRRNRSSSPLLRKSDDALDGEGRHSAGDLDVSGWTLLRHRDFHLLFLYLGLCSGIGLMVINNLGTVTVTLADSDAEPRDVARMQAHLVSLLSVCNCLGRLAVGFLSDIFLHHVPERFRFARVWWLAVTAVLFVLSQILAGRSETVEGVSGLALPTALTGFAYGNLFGSVPVVGLERFGVANYATNNGYLTLAPAAFANFSNFIFGLVYDSNVDNPHSSAPPNPADLPSSFFEPSTTRLLRRRLSQRAGGSATHGVCTLGKRCFATAFETTTVFGCLAVGVAIALATRRSFKPTYHS